MDTRCARGGSDGNDRRAPITLTARGCNILSPLGRAEGCLGMHWRRGLCCVILMTPWLAAAEPSYFRDLQPVLQKNCVSCHQPAMLSSGLDLTTYDKFRAGGKRGPAFAA